MATARHRSRRISFFPFFLALLALLAPGLAPHARGAPPHAGDEADYPPADPHDPPFDGGDTELHWPPNMVVPGGTFGALPGAGSVDARGQYRYRIPIDVPPGRLGMQPRLELVYSSDGGNDLLGVGWSLSGLSVIAPCLKRHATDQVASYGGLCWNGRRLVEVPGTSPPEYRTEEESFARIKSDGAGVGFTVQTKEGRTLVFRRALGGFKLAAALLVEELDQRGNAVEYGYDVVSENEYYPERITYTHRGAEPGKRAVHFGYSKLWREDPIAVYSEGALFKTKRLLGKITVEAPNPETPAAVWEYRLDYDVSPTSKRSRLKSVVRVDFLGGRTLEKTFHWTSTEGPAYEEAPTPYEAGGDGAWEIDASNLNGGHVVADFDQDGRDDLLLAPGGATVFMQHSLAGVPLAGRRALFGLRYGVNDGEQFTYPDLRQARVGDVDGDGYPDLLAPTVIEEGDQAYVLYLWDRVLQDFVESGAVEDYMSSNHAMPLFLSDLNGDGRPDLVKGYEPWVEDDPEKQAWTWYHWGVRLNQGGWFGPKLGSIPGHALGGNEPPFAAHSAATSTGCTRLLAMSSKDIDCGIAGDPTTGADFGVGFDPVSSQPHVVGLPGPAELWVGAEFDELKALTALADLNGDGADDAVDFWSDKNQVCVHLWGNGIDWEPSWESVDEPPCVTIETGSDPEPAETAWVSGPDGGCGHATLVAPAPWRLRVWDVDGDGRHDVVVQHLDKDGDYKPDGQVYRVFLDATGTLQAGPFPQAVGGDYPYADVASVFGDFDGDGRLDVLAFADVPAEEHVGRVLLQTESTADAITGVVDGSLASESEHVEYSQTWRSESSTWPRSWPNYPLYVNDPGPYGIHYVEDDALLTGPYPVKRIRRGFRVVREHDVYQGDDIGVYFRNEYTYADPTFDLRGRGFLGFRVISHHMPDVPSERVTFYDNFHSDYLPLIDQGGVYPGAMRPVHVIQMTPIQDQFGFSAQPSGFQAEVQDAAGIFPARVTHWKGTYKRDPGMTARSYFVHLDTWETREWEQELWEGPEGSMPRFYDNEQEGDPAFVGTVPMEEHATSPVKILQGSVKYDAFGNPTEEHAARPLGRARHTETSYHPPDMASWRLGLIKRREVAVGNWGGPATEPRRVDLEYDEGLLWRVHVEKDHPDPSVRSTVTFERNGDGSVTRITRSAPEVDDRFDTFEYDESERMFVTRAANALDHATRTLTHPAFGVPVASRDPNDVLTTWQLNDRGLPTRVKRAGQAAVKVDYADRASNGLIVTATSSADSAVSVTEHDLRGRHIESRRSGFDGVLIYTKSVHDKLGREIGWSLPAYGQPGSSEGSRRFDSLGRVTDVFPPGGFGPTYEYTFLTTEIATPSDNQTAETKTRITHDLDGRVASSEQYDAEAGEWLATQYLYTDFDLVWKILDPEGNETTFGYDKLGRRTATDEPDAGPSSVEYDGLGNMTATVLGGSVTGYSRDVLGRVWRKDNSDGVTSFTWDLSPHGIGRLAQSVSPDNVVHDFTYDVYGRPKSESWTIDGQPYTFTNAYDVHGRLKSRTYPAAGAIQVNVRQHYNAFGYLDAIDGVHPLTQAVTTYWQTYALAATGGITSGVFGNGVLAERWYDPESGRLDSVHDAGVFYQSYAYDVAGRVQSQEEASGRREEFTYDSLARLKTWTLFPKGPGGGAERVTTFHYDALGNLLSEDIDNAGDLDTIVHSSGTSAYGPHTPAGNYTFDARGRLLNPNGQITTYTEFDLPRQIGETHFRYDAEGTRVSKQGPEGAAITLAGLYERRIDAAGTTDVYLVPGPEGVVAQVALNAALPGGGHTTYVHGARKGSVQATSSDAGLLDTRMYYDPFGVRINLYGNPVSGVQGDVNIGYAGLDHDDELGLINQRGRVYNPSLRRFLTPDPIVSDVLNGQTFNPYSYVRNDPVNRIDPSGLCDMSPCHEGGFIDADGNWWSPMDQADAAAQYYAPGGAANGPGGSEGHGAIVTTGTAVRQAAPPPPESIGVNDQTATPVHSPSWQPSHRWHVWTGPFSSASGELQGIAESTSNNLEWACAKAARFAISGLVFMENVPNAPYMFNLALERAATVKHQATAGERVEASIEAGGYLLNFVATTAVVVAPFAELGAAAPAAPTRATGTAWDAAKATQPAYEGTVIPRSFELTTGSGRVWVHGNATEHMAEYATSMLGRGVNRDLVNLGSQQQLRSLQAAVESATTGGVPYDELLIVGGWELKFAAPRGADQLPALIHALPQ